MTKELKRAVSVSIFALPAILIFSAVSSSFMAGCNFTGTLESELPYCPTTDEGYTARDSVSSLCCPSDSALTTGRVARPAWCLRDTVLAAGNSQVVAAILYKKGSRDFDIYVQDDPRSEWFHRVKEEAMAQALIGQLRSRGRLERLNEIF